LNEEQTRELRFVAQVGEEESAEFAVLATYHPDNTVSMKCKKVVAQEKGKKAHHHEVPALHRARAHTHATHTTRARTRHAHDTHSTHNRRTRRSSP
jgi:hypothetical protein